MACHKCPLKEWENLCKATKFKAVYLYTGQPLVYGPTFMDQQTAQEPRFQAIPIPLKLDLGATPLEVRVPVLPETMALSPSATIRFVPSAAETIQNQEPTAGPSNPQIIESQSDIEPMEVRAASPEPPIPPEWSKLHAYLEHFLQNEVDPPSPEG